MDVEINHFSTGTWNSREDDLEQSVDESQSHQHDDTLIPSNSVTLTEDHSRAADKVNSDR